MPTQLSDTLWNWATDVDEGTLLQAGKASRLPIVSGHIALMPDAHVGMGATVGSVIPTENAVIPAAVGVDIGCGMIAVHTSLVAADLPDDLDPFVGRLGHDAVDLHAGEPARVEHERGLREPRARVSLPARCSRGDRCARTGHGTSIDGAA